MSNLRKLRRELARRTPMYLPGQADLLQRHLQSNPDVLVCRGGNREKMSEIIEDFAEPLLTHAHTLEDMRKAISFAILAWNYALMPPETREELQPPFARVLADPVVKEVFDFLLARKEAEFPDIRRIILDYELQPNGTGLALNVISTIF